MFMAQKKQAVFQWGRKEHIHKDFKHGRKKGSIKDWIQKIEQTSEAALQDALDGELPEFSLKEVIPDDEAVYEAQKLVDGWMRDTNISHIQNELEYKHENWASTTNSILHNTVGKGLDYNENATVLDELQKKYLSDAITSIDFEASTTVEPLCTNLYGHAPSLVDMDDDDIDDTLLVQDVLHGMLSKDFTKCVDLGMKPLAKKAKNPVPKMDIRHEQVKLRGEERRKRNMEKKKVKLDQKDVVQKARERVVFEERQRIAREKAEEKAILVEMEKIKRELAEEKQRREEEVKKKERIVSVAKLQMQMELRKEREEKLLRRKQEEEVRLCIQNEMEEEAIVELKMRMKILHKYLSIWYNVVLQQRLKLGKAQAVAEWKCKVRAWNAWRAYVCCVKTNQEAKAIELSMKERYRKEQMAICHANRTLLCKCFISWQKYSRYESEKALIRLEREETTKKMALFLEEASTGRLWEKKQESVKSSSSVDKINLDQMKVQIMDGKECSKSILKPKDESYRREPLDKVKDSEVKETKLTKQVKKKNEHQNIVYMTAFNRNDSVDNVSVNNETKLVDGKGILKQQTVSGESNLDLSHKVHLGAQLKKATGIEVSAAEFAGKIVPDRSDVSFVNSENSATCEINATKQKVRSEKPTTKPLHLAMEDREKERKLRKAAIEKEKRKREEERLAVLRAKESERLKLDQLEKEEKLKQRQEQKKMEALKQKEKKLRLEQFKLKETIAKDHYHNVLLRKYGLEPLSRLVQIGRLNVQIGDKYHSSILLRSYFIEWHVYVNDLSSSRKKKADECYQNILKKRAFHSWLKCRFHLQNMNEIARNFSINLILKNAFNAWQEYVTDERILMWAKESSAEEHDTIRMMKYCFKSWIAFVEMEKESREREFRKDEFRKKVHSWLPDYKGGLETAT